MQSFNKSSKPLRLFLIRTVCPPLSAGTHELTLTVDSENTVQETNENNNVFHKVFTVLGTTPPPSLSINDISINEGSSGVSIVTFTVTFLMPLIASRFIAGARRSRAVGYLCFFLRHFSSAMNDSFVSTDDTLSNSQCIFSVSIRSSFFTCRSYSNRSVRACS